MQSRNYLYQLKWPHLSLRALAINIFAPPPPTTNAEVYVQLEKFYSCS
jgi:hypothetical protein